MSKLKSSAREFVLVVVGVLLAFAIQARWEDWQDSRQDAGYIEGLRGELSKRRADLERDLTWARNAAVCGDSLQMAWNGTGDIGASRLPHLLWMATSVTQVSAAPFRPWRAWRGAPPGPASTTLSSN